MKGFFNMLLRIDLTDRSFRYEEIPDATLGATLGGKGLGVHYLARENPVGVDPLRGMETHLAEERIKGRVGQGAGKAAASPASCASGRREKTGCASPASSRTGGGASAEEAWAQCSAQRT